MARNYNIPYIFYTFFWASEIKNQLPSQNLDLSRAAGQWICQVLSGGDLLFVCVEVLRPSQPNGVMSSMVSLPKQFTCLLSRLSPLSG